MRPALLTGGALALGIAAAGWARPHPALPLAGMVICLIWAARSQRRTMAALLAAVAALGCFRYSYEQTAGRGSLGAWEGQKVWITATVVTEPEVLPSGSTVYVAAVELVDDQPARGRVQVAQWAGELPGYGERVRLQGRLEQPPGPRRPGGFDEAAHLARQGVYLTMDGRSATVLGPGRLDPFRRAAVALRQKMEEVLKATLPRADAALLAGLLLGSREDLPEEISRAFRESGVFHLLAVSGGNVAMILVPFLAMLRWAGFRRRWAAAAGIPLVAFFVLLTGATPSVLRAGLMAVLVLLGDLLGRERDGLNTLGAAVLLLLVAKPSLLFDVGFQLSAAATLGILLFTRPIEHWLSPRLQSLFGPRAGRWIAAGLAVTLGAQAMVEPISLHYFGALSVIAPVANLLVALCQAPVVYTGTVSLLAGLVFLPLARLLGFFVQGGLWVLVFLVKAAAAVPGGFLEVGRLPFSGVICWYAALWLAVRREEAWRLLRAGVQHWQRWASVGRRQWQGAVLGLGLGAAALLTWQRVLAGPGDLLTVTFLDVGQGDAILIQAPGGEAMLVDAGPAFPPHPEKGWAGWDAGASVVVPYLRRQGVHRLDGMVITHADQDHAGGAAAVLRSLPVAMLLHSGVDHPEQHYQEALRLAKEAGVPMVAPRAGHRFTLGNEVAVEVINPPAEERAAASGSADNNGCVALRLAYREVSFLLTCDLEEAAEARLMAQRAPLKADVLKVAHHGAQGSSSGPFLEAVSPTWAVISVGAGNAYGHPHQATLERLSAQGVQLFRTDRHGVVTFRTDGYRIWARGSRGWPEAPGSRPVGLLGRRWLLAW